MGVKILNVSSLAQNCTKIQGPFPQKTHAFFIKAMHHCKHSSFYLPNMKKILWDISSNTEKINLRVALFLEHKPQNLPSNSHFNLFNSHHTTFMSELSETIDKKNSSIKLFNVFTDKTTSQFKQFFLFSNLHQW